MSRSVCTSRWHFTWLAIVLGFSLLASACGTKRSASDDSEEDVAVRDRMLQLESPQDFARQEAAQELAKMGPRARAAIPALQKALNDNNVSVRMTSAEALAAMAPEVREVMPALIAGLSVDRPFVPEIVMKALTRFGKDAVPALIKALPHPNAAETLGLLGPVAKDAVPALMAIVENQETTYGKSEAARALGRIGSPPTNAIASMTEALRVQRAKPRGGDAGNIKLEMTITLLQLDPQNVLANECIQECLKDENVHVRIMAADALVRLHPGDKAAIKRLADQFQGAGVDRYKVVECLARLGPAAKDHFPMLRDALLVNDTSAPARSSIPEALTRLDPKAAVPVLLRVLKEKRKTDAHMRICLANALGIAGPEAKEAIATLRDMAQNDGVANVREAAEQALQKIGSPK